MANLSELTTFKEELLRRIVMNPRVMQAVVNKEEDCFSKPVQKPGLYLYKNIFPYKWTVDETLENKETFITMDFANFSLVNSHYKDFSMALYVFTHKELMLISDGGHRKLRVDFIIEELDTMLNNARGFGIGKLQFGGLSSTSVTNDIMGSVIAYNTIDFNDSLTKGNE